MIQAQPRRRQPAVVALDPHVRAREDRRREADERRQRDEEDVERVDEEHPVEDEQRAAGDDADRQCDGGGEREAARRDVDARSVVALADEREDRRAGHRDREDEQDLDHAFRLFQLLHVLQVEAVELLADLEEEHAEDEHRDQHVERDAELDDHRHAVSRAGRREEQAVFHRQEADHLRDRLAPRDHHQERQHHARQRDAQRRARHGVGELRDRQRQVEREDDEHDADQHRRGDVDQALELPADVELADEPVEQPRQRDDLEREREPRRPVEVRLRGGVGDDTRRHRERQALRREQVDQRQHASLRQHREGEQQQQRGEHVDELRVEGDAGHGRQPPAGPPQGRPGSFAPPSGAASAVSVGGVT